jgi:threonine synthase
MDILISSNLERLLYMVCGSKKCSEYMSKLKNDGRYTLENDELKAIREIFDAGYADDEDTYNTIREVYDNYGYLMDTHTAVAWKVYEEFARKNKNGYKTVVLSTASAYKFSSGVLHSLGMECPNEFDAIDVLSKRTGIIPPPSIRDIRNKAILHENVVEKENMQDFVSNAIIKNKVKVRVPATSANLGSGFDCTGIAFKRYDVLEFEKIESGMQFEGFKPEFSNPDNLAALAYKKTCEKIGVSATVKVRLVKTDIPIARGLGSSAALIVAGAYAANALNGNKLSVQEIFEICNNIEGHPDNIAPALFGGLCTSIVDNGKPTVQKYNVSPDICFTALVPSFAVSTKDARAVLPENISREDAIFNMQRVALLPYAFEHGRLDLIPLVTDDRLHERYRMPLYKNINEVEDKAIKLGAISFTVSGAGPTCLAYSKRPIFEELNKSITSLENEWVAYGLTVDNEGAKEIYD